MSRRVDLTLALGLFVAALLLRLMVLLPMRFDGLYGQDSYAYYDFAEELRTAISEGHAPGHFFWPLGYPAVLAGTFAIFGSEATVGQMLNVLMGAALSPLVYGLARLMAIGQLGSIAASILMMMCGQALQSSIVLMSDIPGLFWATTSALMMYLYLQKIEKSEQPLHPYGLITAAMLLALAGITRWIYLLLALPYGTAVLIGWRGQIRWRDGLLALAGVCLVLMPQLLYSRTNPAPTLNHAWVEGWSPTNFSSKTFDNVDGHFEYEKINAVYYAQPFYDVHYLAPIFTPFLLIGLWSFRQKRMHLVMIEGWILLPYLFLVGIPYQNIRFPLIVFPPVAILVGAGLDALKHWLGRQNQPHPLSTSPNWRGRINILRSCIALLIIVGVLVFGTGQMWSKASDNISQFIGNQQKDKDAAQWADRHIPPGATLYTFGLTLTLKHYTDLQVYEIYYETPDTLAAKWNINQNDYLLLNVWNIENQWAGREPQIAYHWLRDQRGLYEIGKFGYYTLYEVEHGKAG